MFEEQEPMRSALIVAGGDLSMTPRIQTIIDAADYIVAADSGDEHCLNSVSYTHLTLPTKREV